MFLCSPCFSNFAASKLSWIENFEKNCSSNKKLYDWCKTFPNILKGEYLEGSEEDYIRQLNNILKFLLNKNNSSPNLFKEEQSALIEISTTKDEKKELEIDIAFVDIPNEFILSENNSEISKDSLIEDERNSKISRMKATPIESDIEDFGSFPQKFAHYENNSFFGEHLYETRKIDKKNINFVNDEIKSEENLLIFKKILKLFERHLNDNACPLNFLRETYIFYLKTNYKQEPPLYFEKNGKAINQKKAKEKSIIKDIDCFISILTTLVLDFYHINSNYYIASNRNLRNLFHFESLRYFLINSLFNIDSLYDFVYEIEKSKNFKKEQDFQDGIKRFPDLILQDFGVSKQFLLDESPFDPENKELDFSNMNYIWAIDCIKNLQFIRSPVHKLKSVILCGLMIKKAIEDFYFKLHKKIAHNMIQPREFIRILFFAVYKSNIPCMISHLNMMQEFVHKNVVDSLKLPFFTYFRISVEFFQRLKDGLPQKKYFSRFLQEFLNDRDLS